MTNELTEWTGYCDVCLAERIFERNAEREWACQSCGHTREIRRDLCRICEASCSIEQLDCEDACPRCSIDKPRILWFDGQDWRLIPSPDDHDFEEYVKAIHSCPE